jgi:hypothetical protein
MDKRLGVLAAIFVCTGGMSIVIADEPPPPDPQRNPAALKSLSREERVQVPMATCVITGDDIRRSGVPSLPEGGGFLRSGGMIAFAPDNRCIGFSVNPGAARGAMLNLSSRLLAVAKPVDR